MAEVYGQSRLCICRAGATTLAELAALGMPAILVPYPRAAEDHQTINARYFAERGAAVIIPDAELTPDALQKTLQKIDNPDTLGRMSAQMKALGAADAAERISAYIRAAETPR
jgi:UDP-N-acetylglucosamine--N-acetylmuramyl-(pentapeptide) pyrophosphoryl-undecaprenol N-acetylglucosamine transferase